MKFVLSACSHPFTTSISADLWLLAFDSSAGRFNCS